MNNIDWGYATIIAAYLAASIGYAFHDGSDPWTAAFLLSVLILIGKGLAKMAAGIGGRDE